MTDDRSPFFENHKATFGVKFIRTVIGDAALIIGFDLLDCTFN
jgi:hypothetical protein